MSEYSYRILRDGEETENRTFLPGTCITFELTCPRMREVCFYLGCDAEVIVHAQVPQTGESEDGCVYAYALRTEQFAPDGRGLFFFHWEAETENGRIYSSDGDGQISFTDRFTNEFQLLVYKDEYEKPVWLKNGIFYQIFVDRFCRSGKSERKANAVYNDDWENGVPEYAARPGIDFPNNTHFGGDLYGIAEKLDYLQELGVTCLYLSPVCEAFSNHKYDTGDYLRVDPSFGGDDALRYLCEQVHARDMHILLDGVFNHVGNDSVYFNAKGHYDSVGAYQSPDSPYAEWFSFGDTREQYDSWWGMKNLPKTVRCASFREFICGQVIPHYMALGADGFRLDVADELEGSFLEEIAAAVKKCKKDAVVLGEVWEDASNKIAYDERKKYFQGRQLDGVMNYPFRNGMLVFLQDGDPSLLRMATETLTAHYPPDTMRYTMNFLGTHDTERILTVLGGEPDFGEDNDVLAARHMTADEREKAKRLLCCGYALLAALPGTPCIYYGDEAGMEGYHDPLNRRPFPWKHIDAELCAWFSRVNGIRKEESLFSCDSFRVLESREGFFSFERSDRATGRKMTAVCNLQSHSEPLRLPADTKELLYNELCGGETSIPPMQTRIYISERN